MGVEVCSFNKPHSYVMYHLSELNEDMKWNYTIFKEASQHGKKKKDNLFSEKLTKIWNHNTCADIISQFSALKEKNKQLGDKTLLMMIEVNESFTSKCVIEL